MTTEPPRREPGVLCRRVTLGFKLIDELVQFIEVNPGPETEGVRYRPRCRAPARLRLLAKAGAERPVDHLLERQPKFACAPLQEASDIVINGQCSSHRCIMDANKIDVKTSTFGVCQFENLGWWFGRVEGYSDGYC
jgi:hypothetical protein